MNKKPETVKSHKLLTASQMDLNTTKASGKVGTTIAHASGNTGMNTVESHCLNSFTLQSDHSQPVINELKSQVATLQLENRILLARIGLLLNTAESNVTAYKAAINTVKETPKAVVMSDKKYCDSSHTVRFERLCKQIQSDMSVVNNDRYGKGKPYPSIMAFYLAQKIKLGKANSHLMQVTTLETLEHEYKLA